MTAKPPPFCSTARPSAAIAATAIACLMLFLAACGPSTVTANVLRFHALTSLPGNATFTVTPGEGQEGSLEFRAYAELVTAEMVHLGYRPAPAGKAAELTVLMNYTVDNGRTEIWTVPIYGYTDNWRRFYSAQGGRPSPFFDQVGVDTHSTTLFTHRLELRIADNRKSETKVGEARMGAGKADNLFEGRSFAERTTRELAVTMPYLVAALFDGFPGENGVPTLVRLPESQRIAR